MAQSSNENKWTSPYVKYGKTPYRYSDELNNWTAAIKKGDKAGADRHDRSWKKKFGITNAPRPDYDELDSMYAFMEEDQDAYRG